MYEKINLRGWMGEIIVNSWGEDDFFFSKVKQKSPVTI